MPRLITSLIYLLFLVSIPAMWAHADRLSLTDARALALGGTGVAMGSMHGALNNPALLAYKHGFTEWGMSFPTTGATQPYPQDFKDSYNEFKNQPNKQNRDRLIDKSHNEIAYAAIIGAIPNTILGGSMYYTGYEFKSFAIEKGDDSFTSEQTVINSTLEKRSVLVIEHGFSIAKVLNEQARGQRSFSFGLSPKIVLLQAEKAQQTLDNMDLSIRYSGEGSASAFNVDVGILQEFGRITFGMFVKNLIPVKVKFGNRNDALESEKFVLYPEFRSGLAYQKRSLAWELDIGVLANNGIHFDELSVYSALGIEYKLAKYFVVRLGYRQELLPTYTGRMTFGLELGHDYYVDLAVIAGETDAGAGITLGLNY